MKDYCLFAHLGLNQEVPLSANVFEEAEDVDCALVLDLLQHTVDHNVGPSPSHTSTGTETESEPNSEDCHRPRFAFLEQCCNLTLSCSQVPASKICIFPLFQ